MTLADYKARQQDSINEARQSRPQWWNADKESSDVCLDWCQKLLDLLYSKMDLSTQVKDTVEARFAHVTSGVHGPGFYFCWLDWQKKKLSDGQEYDDCARYFGFHVWPKSPIEFYASPYEGRGAYDEDEEADRWTIEEMVSVDSPRVIDEIMRVVQVEE